MSDWRRVTVTDVAVPKGLVGGPFGSSLGSKDYVAAGVPVIRGSNLGSLGTFDARDFVYVTPEKANGQLARNQARPGDVVFTQRGTLGQVGIVPAEPHDCYVISQSQMRLRVDRSVTTPEFVYYQFRSPEMVRNIHSRAITAGVPHINLGILASLGFVLPPLEVQQDIVTVLGALDAKIAVNERIAATALELGSAKFRLLRESATETTTVGDLVELKYGKALPAARRVAGDVPVFGSGGVSGSHDEPLVKGPGVIIGRKGTVGAVYWSEVDFFPIDTTFYVVCANGRVSLEYMYFALKGLGLEHMNSDSAVPGLNRERARSLSLRIPESDAVQEFTADVGNLFRLQRSLEEESRTLATLRDTLLPPLMSGRLRVKDAEKIVEDAT
ncbi:restriction endonuclease subunit S [Streptomyces sp. NPDC126497]|uniref:restriction endonuclease subunit S n=1 Tax=Streptomyces sp. NPDC126497 TaxID=3155313 RepID=UPI00331A95C4